MDELHPRNERRYITVQILDTNDDPLDVSSGTLSAVVSKDGAATAAAANDPPTKLDATNGVVNILVSADEMDADHVAVIIDHDDANAKAELRTFRTLSGSGGARLR